MGQRRELAWPDGRRSTHRQESAASLCLEPTATSSRPVSAPRLLPPCCSRFGGGVVSVRTAAALGVCARARATLLACCRRKRGEVLTRMFFSFELLGMTTTPLVRLKASAICCIVVPRAAATLRRTASSVINALDLLSGPWPGAWLGWVGMGWVGGAGGTSHLGCGGAGNDDGGAGDGGAGHGPSAVVVGGQAPPQPPPPAYPGHGPHSLLQAG